MLARRPPRRDAGPEAGFTLIELLVAIVVLGVLATIVVIAVGHGKRDAQVASCQADRKTLTSALEAYRADAGRYPTAAEGFAALTTGGGRFLREAPSATRWTYDAVAGNPVGVGPCLTVASDATPTDLDGTVTVFAATSLSNAFGDIRTKLEAANPGLHVTYSFGGSPTVVAQVNAGAPADVLATADEPSAAALSGAKDGGRSTFATNELAIVTRPGNPVGITGLADLFGPGRRVVLCATGVPCGTAANTALATIGKTRSDLGGNLVSETANVGLVLTSVANGSNDTVGIAYTTDVAGAGGTVGSVAIPDAQNAVNRYPIIQIRGAAHQDLARAFVDYVLGSEGQAILRARGFGAP